MSFVHVFSIQNCFEKFGGRIIEVLGPSRPLYEGSGFSFQISDVSIITSKASQKKHLAFPTFSEHWILTNVCITQANISSNKFFFLVNLAKFLKKKGIIGYRIS
jgi:hypothetical protein